MKDKEIIYKCDKSCLNKLKDFNGADIDTMLNLAVQFSDSKKLNFSKYTLGLEYFLKGYKNSQSQIQEFIDFFLFKM